MNKHTLILVVDDDDNDLQMTRETITSRGSDLEVCTARDGAEALDFLHCRERFKDRPVRHPDLLLLDLNMPRIDGWEVLREIKDDPAFKTIPVVVFTSSSRDHDLALCYELGANAYVVKPIDFREFTEAVRGIQSFWTKHNHPPVPLPTPSGASVPAGAKAGSPP